MHWRLRRPLLRLPQRQRLSVTAGWSQVPLSVNTPSSELSCIVGDREYSKQCPGSQVDRSSSLCYSGGAIPLNVEYAPTTRLQLWLAQRLAVEGRDKVTTFHWYRCGSAIRSDLLFAAAVRLQQVLATQGPQSSSLEDLGHTPTVGQWALGR